MPFLKQPAAISEFLCGECIYPLPRGHRYVTIYSGRTRPRLGIFIDKLELVGVTTFTVSSFTLAAYRAFLVALCQILVTAFKLSRGTERGKTDLDLPLSTT